MGGRERETSCPSQAFFYHLVFATQDRHPWITDEIEQRLYEYLGGIIRGQRGTKSGDQRVEDHIRHARKTTPEPSSCGCASRRPSQKVLVGFTRISTLQLDLPGSRDTLRSL